MAAKMRLVFNGAYGMEVWCMWAGAWSMPRARMAMGAKIKTREANILPDEDRTQDKSCAHRLHTSASQVGSQNLQLLFRAALYFFYFSPLSCSFQLLFRWVSTLRGFIRRNQFCLASLPLEGNIGIYKYSHAAISDPQLRDWTRGWAVLLFDHGACIHASLWRVSLLPDASLVPQLSSSPPCFLPSFLPSFPPCFPLILLSGIFISFDLFCLLLLSPLDPFCFLSSFLFLSVFFL